MSNVILPRRAVNGKILYHSQYMEKLSGNKYKKRIWYQKYVL